MEKGVNKTPLNSFLFKNPRDEALYLRAYNLIFSSFHLKPEEITIVTSFGATHVNTFGVENTSPLILLHGMGASSAMWAPNIVTLCRHFHIYAPDTIGDLGKSRCNERLRYGQDYSKWLKEIFDELNLDKVDIAGVSYGGWLAFNFAINEPDRIKKIISIAPAGIFQKTCLEFYIRITPLLLFPAKKFRKYFLLNFIRWLTGVSDLTSLEVYPLLRQYLCGASLSHSRLVALPKIFSDVELKKINIPTLLLIGEKEVIYHPRKVLERANSTMPNVTTQIVPDGTHMMSWEKADAINSLMIAYLFD